MTKTRIRGGRTGGRLITRRKALFGPLSLGCSLAASPLFTPVTFASPRGAGPQDARLVVIILRGAMDGLDVVRPLGDRHFAAARPGLMAAEGGQGDDLDGFFALHPGLAGLMPLWRAGELGFVHATSTPYRDRRSHFDGQDLLEAGTGSDLRGAAVRDGWLNRLLQTRVDIRSETAFAVGRDELAVLRGAAPVSVWAPETGLGMRAATARLAGMLFHDDPLLRVAWADATRLSRSLGTGREVDSYREALAEMRSAMQEARSGENHLEIAAFTAERLREDTRIAAFSLGGWDTHDAQTGGLRRALAELNDVILGLKSGLGATWELTTVLAMTEFGRTLRENGTGGTDHGTGGAMLMAGGAVRGSKIYGRWPGLAAAELYQQRDLMPTTDVRAWAASALLGAFGGTSGGGFGLDRATLETTVFPGLDMAAVPEILR